MPGLREKIATAAYRDMPWRQIDDSGLIDPYKVLVSEIMLQQTQVSRVLPKFEAFIERFPTANDLVVAPLAEVLRMWNGLGYNRRAKYLHQAAHMIMHDFNGHFPQTVTELITLPGVGKNTAGAVVVYAFNKPAVFIETNIRTVYIHHFFKNQTDIPDSAILAKLEATLDRKNPRQFYWQLMDYGAQLKGQYGNVSRKSRHYTKQSTFEGSLRQLRGQVLRALVATDLTGDQLRHQIDDQRLPRILESLQAEGLITKKKQHYCLG